MANIIDRIKDKLGNIIYPITTEKAVYDDLGVRLDSKIEDINDKFIVRNVVINPTATTSVSSIQAFKVGDIVTVSGVIARTGSNTLMNALTETKIASIVNLADRPSMQVETSGTSDSANNPVIVRFLTNGDISIYSTAKGLAVRFSITYNTKA